MTTGRQPPRLGRWLVHLWRLSTRRHDIEQDVEGDLLDLFEIRARDRGPRFAARRYILDALSLWRCRHHPRTTGADARYRGGREMLQDIGFAARLFRRQPGLFGLTVAGLALAIGISTAVFSTVKAVAFGGYGISDPGSVYRVALDGARLTKPTGPAFQGNWSFADYQRLQERGLLAHARGLGVGRSPVRRQPQRDQHASSALSIGHRIRHFSALGMRPAHGRLLTPADDVPGAATAVVGYGFWKNRLGANDAIVGRTVWLNGHAFVVVGVANRAHGSPASDGRVPAFWITLAGHADMSASAASRNARETRARLDALRRTATDPGDRQRLQGIEADVAAADLRWNPSVDVFGRPQPGVTRAQAETEVRPESPRPSSASSILAASRLPYGWNRSSGRTGRPSPWPPCS